MMASSVIAHETSRSNQLLGKHSR